MSYLERMSLAVSFLSYPLSAASLGCSILYFLNECWPGGHCAVPESVNLLFASMVGKLEWSRPKACLGKKRQKTMHACACE